MSETITQEGGMLIMPDEKPKEVFREEIVKINEYPRKVFHVPITWEDKDAEVVVKRMSVKEKQTYISKVTRVRQMGRGMLIEPIIEMRQIYGLMFGIHTAPFDHKDEKFISEGLDPELAERLFGIVCDVNNLNEEKK